MDPSQPLALQSPTALERLGVTASLLQGRQRALESWGAGAP